MEIFETHAHLDLPDFSEDRAEIIAGCLEAGITRIINIGFNQETSENAIAIAEQYPFIFATVGYHPHDAVEYNAEAIKELARHEKVVALGEIGLDYFRNISPRYIQRQVFEEQILLAQEYDLPIIVHCRDAHDDCYEILKQNNAKEVVFHCFSGDVLFAEKIISEGWNLSFAGNITYKKSNLDDVIRMVPNEVFFVETDSPYLAPTPHRGERNDPTYLPYVIQKIAEVRGQTPKKIAEITYANAMKFFRMI
jgi:TatD DNase family protein